MNKTEFIAEIAKKTGMSHAKADEAVNAILDAISAALKKGEKVTLTGFGSFEVRHHAARPGRNIRTQEKITIPAGNRPAFSAGAVLKAAVNTKAKTKPANKK
jgi:DNA-binding protein HU-beta